MSEHTYELYGHKAKPKRNIGRTIFRAVVTLFVVAALALGGLVAFLTVTEYNPPDREKAEMRGSASRTLVAGEEFSILTWNLGYGALGDNADFFMDGGTRMLTASPERVNENMADILSEITTVNPDIALLQEVDVESKRSAEVNEVKAVADSMPEAASYYATNYRTAYVPLGIPSYGNIEGGLQTLSTFKTNEATRLALPSSYSWPMSTVQLKRCELVLRIPVEGSDRELVLINIHPDAYTDEEHHAAQIAAIKETLETEAAAGNWVIAGGDWNHSFSNIDISAYPLLNENYWQAGVIDTRDFEEGWQFVMDSTHPTCRLLNIPLVEDDGTRNDATMQYYVIDGFILSSNVRLVSIETHDLKFKASDHNPVVMKVLLEND